MKQQIYKDYCSKKLNKIQKSGNMMKNRIFVPIPRNLKAEDIASFTPKRQEILLNLLHGEKTLINLIKEIRKRDIDASTVFKTLKDLMERNFVQKDSNKVYSLTTEGKFLCLVLAQPNGMSEEKIRNLLDEILEEDLKIKSEDLREEIIENWRNLGEILEEAPNDYSKLLEEGYKKSAKENAEVAEKMEDFIEEL